jgi:excisionase family DNA binding protein
MATTNGVAVNFLYDVLTLAEAAAYLKLSEEAVRTEAETGRLVGRAVGDDWRFARGDVLKWVRGPNPPNRPDPIPHGWQETEEEHQAYWANIQAFRDEVDRLHKRGKYAEEE